VVISCGHPTHQEESLMTVQPPAPSWQPVLNVATVAAMTSDAAIELSSRLAHPRLAHPPGAPAAPATRHTKTSDPVSASTPPALDVATIWEVAMALSPALGQLAKTLERLGGAAAGVPHGDQDDAQVADLAEALTETAERLDAAADHLAMLAGDPEVAEWIAQLAPPSAPGAAPRTAGAAGIADQARANDAGDDPYCPVTGGRHRIDWPTLRLPHGHCSVLANCAACGQAGELNLIDEDDIDWPADLVG